MSIPMNSTCIQCFLSKRLEFARQQGTEQQATEVGRMLMRAFVEAPPHVDSAWLGGVADEIVCRYFNIAPDRLRREKAQSNQFVLDRLPQIRSRVAQAADPVYAALQFAVLGNYLDFSALAGKVSFAHLDTMLEQALEMVLDQDCYRHFLSDLQKGKTLLYITDNAGEIGFDRVLAEVLQQHFPHLQITFCVRGLPVSNDATREDAQVVGIPFPLLDNGTAIGGTVLHLISPEAKQAIEQSDVILAKGMGNTESMFGCGHNVYYSFLVKCQRFVEYFQKEMMTPMFIRDSQYTAG